jgi:acyl-CoA thioester hydrolase
VSRTAVYRARAGYVDTDQGGVVHHATYLRWFEQARIELLREGGLVYREWEDGTRMGLPVVELSVRYLQPVRFDEVIVVETHLGAAARTALRFDYRSSVEGRSGIVNEAQVRLACVHLSGGPRRIPDEVLRACLGDDFEAELVTALRTRVGRP